MALAAMSAAVYLAFEHNLRSSLDENLRDRSASYESLVDTTVEPAQLLLAVDTRQERAKGEAVVRLYDPNGRLLEDAPRPQASNSRVVLVELPSRNAGLRDHAGSQAVP